MGVLTLLSVHLVSFRAAASKLAICQDSLSATIKSGARGQAVFPSMRQSSPCATRNGSARLNCKYW
jgi:hypothetical protein